MARKFRWLFYAALLVVNGTLLPKDAVDPRRISWSKCPQTSDATLKDCITLLTDKDALRREIEGRLKWLGLPYDLGGMLPQFLKGACHDEIAADDRTDYSMEAHGVMFGPERHVPVTFRVCTYRA